MSDLNKDIEKEIRRYLRGEMTPAEMHALEKKALSDPFLADALEGGGTLGAEDFLKDVSELNEKTKKKRNYTLRIAAGILVILSLSLILLLPKDEQKHLANQEIKEPVKKEKPAKEVEKPKVARQKPKEEKSVSTPKTEKEETAPPPTVYSLRNDSIQETKPSHTSPRTSSQIPSHTITGTVTTFEDKLPLPGVTILIKGTTIGTTTDVAGNYAIQVPDTSSLVFSFVGMKPSEMKVAEKNKLDVKMTEDVSQLGEVVVARPPLLRSGNETPEVKLAEPVGGLKAYDKYLEDKKRYPQQALDANVKGRVIIGFDVSIRGELTNFMVIRGLGYGCDDEVIRLIKEGPAWNPTTESNVAVESTVHVKMKFDAPKFKKKRKS